MGDGGRKIRSLSIVLIIWRVWGRDFVLKFERKKKVKGKKIIISRYYFFWVVEFLFYDNKEC